ncbi:MAG: ATP-dependent protease LonB [Clostridium sp.]
MNQILIFLQIALLVVLIYSLYQNTKNSKARTVVIDKENKKEMDKLIRMREVKLTEPLTEKSRPKNFDEIIGQEEGIKALKAALCGPNPQHVIIYGPPGVGKTAAARLVLEEAKNRSYTPFKTTAKFIEIDATTLRYDERGIADPLIGSVHDPIYQGAGSLGIAGIPQPKPGAVTKAHGGMLFIDEIGELHSIQLNKLLKVLEDRKVFLDSSYFSSEDTNMPTYIKEVFEKGLPADFRLIGATTRKPGDIVPALRSRCVEIFFRALSEEEIEKIAVGAIEKSKFKITQGGSKLISQYCRNGRDVINLVQLCIGIATENNRNEVIIKDIEWVVENGQYDKRIDHKVNSEPKIGIVNGLAIYGSEIGMLMGIEVTAKESVKTEGELVVTGIVEEEEIKDNNRRIRRKSTVYSSIQNVITMLRNNYNIDCKKYDVHINIPGGIPVDGPSAGAAIALGMYSAITKLYVNNKVAMTGEITLLGNIKSIGGVKGKIEAAKRSGAEVVIIPYENWSDALKEVKGISIRAVSSFDEVLKLALIDERNSDILCAQKSYIRNMVE